MTSASELFHSRRFRPVRDQESAVRFSPVDSDPGDGRRRDQHHCLYCRRRSRWLHNQDGYSLSHLVHGGHPHLCRSFDLGISHADDQGTSGEIPSFERRDRLPGAVLQARARLLERLRSVSLSRRSRHSTLPSVTSPWDGEGEAKPLKPAALSPESIASLPRELYSPPTNTSAFAPSENSPKDSPECCICLEPFHDGDSLLRLHCRHRFHSRCLLPWLKDRGDCPYCRSTIASADPATRDTVSGVLY